MEPGKPGGSGMADKLKRCPCCGRKAKVEDNKGYVMTYAIACTAVVKCGLRGAWYYTEKGAINAWNRRADDD